MSENWTFADVGTSYSAAYADDDDSWGSPISEANPEPDPQEYCDCIINGPRRNVLVDINDGRITVIACGNCEYPILLDGSVDNFERVYANGLMLAMTTSVEPAEEHRGFGRYETVSVRFRELTAHEDAVAE